MQVKNINSLSNTQNHLRLLFPVPSHKEAFPFVKP